MADNGVPHFCNSTHPMSTPASTETRAVGPAERAKPERDFLDALPVSTATHELVLKIVPLPADCNANGDIFGGWVMSHVDIAGAVPAHRIAQGRTATVAVKECVFRHPVRVGDILSFYATVVQTGRTSITIAVDVYAERFHDQGKYLKVTQATLTYVAIDETGKPRPIAPDTQMQK